MTFPYSPFVAGPYGGADVVTAINALIASLQANGDPPAAGFSFSPRAIYSGGQSPLATSSGTDSTPVTTEFYITEVKVPANLSITGLSIFQGSVSSGNCKVGLADCNGNVVATSASTAASGTTAYQRIPFTAPYNALGPATYYGMLFFDNNTARFVAHAIGDFGGTKATTQVYATGFTNFTPPTTFTAANKPPMFSLY